MENENVTPEVDAALLAGLASRAGELSTIAENLIETIRLSRLSRIFIVLAALVLLGGMAANLYNTHATNRNTQVIISCTDPSGACYKDSRKTTAGTVKLINDTVIATVSCSKLPENKTYAEIRACVIATLSHS